MICKNCGKEYTETMDMHSKTTCKRCWYKNNSQRNLKDEIYEYCKKPRQFKEIAKALDISPNALRPVILKMRKRSKLMSIEQTGTRYKLYLSVPNNTWGYNRRDDLE